MATNAVMMAVAEIIIEVLLLAGSASYLRRPHRCYTVSCSVIAICATPGAGALRHRLLRLGQRLAVRASIFMP